MRIWWSVAELLLLVIAVVLVFFAAWNLI
jgi:hypothetical protein